MTFIMTLNIHAQELVKSGELPNIQYVFKASEHHYTKTNLTHAIAYAHSKDIVDIVSNINYRVTYTVDKKPGKGFETIICIHPYETNGFLDLYQFDITSEILPTLTDAKLFYSEGSNFIYVKPITGIDADPSKFYFSLKHQRFSPDWELSLRQLNWKFDYTDSLFIEKWSYINDYQMANEWFDKIEMLVAPENILEKYIVKLRWLQFLKEIQELDFYQEFIIDQQNDPMGLEEKINIQLFILERELAHLKTEIYSSDNAYAIADLINSYFQIEKDLLLLSYQSTNLYGDLYYDFNTESKEYYCLNEIAELITFLQLENQWKDFEYGIQDLSIKLMEQLIIDKRANEALFQVRRFNYFHKNAEFLSSSTTFSHFKAKAVYDIYLSYIEVSNQALEQNRIDMAINYLGKASHIQKEYPIEIINDIKVERELQTLIKKALERYQILIEAGEIENAKRVKQGILGLMKKLGHYETDIISGDS